MGLFGGTTLNIWRDMEVVVCLSAKITSETPLVWHFIEYQKQDLSSCVFFPVILAPRQRTHLWNCFTEHSYGFSRSKIAPCTSSSFSFTISCFFLSIPPSVLLFWAVLTPLKHSTSLSDMFVYICVPSNNKHPINARAPSLGLRLSLFSEVSYYFENCKTQQHRELQQLNLKQVIKDTQPDASQYQWCACR